MEAFETLRVEVDSDGIALITLDDPSQPVNTVSLPFLTDLGNAIERVAGDSGIRGAIITSGKAAFLVGADLKALVDLAGEITERQAFALSQQASRIHRRLETCGKPFVAAVNGLALGGGFELCLACHHRVIVDDPGAIVGLPEVSLGLLPGSGGTQRLPRMIGIAAALPALLEGKKYVPAEAFKLGLVDAVVPATTLITAARTAILNGLEAVRAWDRKEYRPSPGLLDGRLAALYSVAQAQIAARTQHNYPAPIAILRCVYEGSLIPLDRALELESKFFAQLLCDPVSRNLIRTTFISQGELAGLSRRCAGVPKARFTKVGILGAGMMGSGIAHAAAVAGMDVVLLDADLLSAERGKAYSVKVLDKDVERGRKTRDEVESILGRIRPTVDYQELAGCELVIEAVYEDRAVKADVIRKAEAVMATTAILASNTSTLPISALAEASQRAEQFIGLHFFSPVERMRLVEVIEGSRTSPQTVARSLDFVAQLKKVPIVVADRRGFYTSRVFQTFVNEGMRMVEEGVAPALVENAAKLAGMPVGPLAVADEVSIELGMRIVRQAEESLGTDFLRPSGYNVMRRMLEEFNRPGKRAGKGFYDYPEDGKKRLWPGLTQAFPPLITQPAVAELKKRLLYIQALETARCLEEGVLVDSREGDVGSVLGWGFPTWAGGTLSLIDTVGLDTFVAECDDLTRRCGDRFAPSRWLRQRAARNARFYGG